MGCDLRMETPSAAAGPHPGLELSSPPLPLCLLTSLRLESHGGKTVLWRAWETREQNLARGVKPESMGSAWGAK